MTRAHKFWWWYAAAWLLLFAVFFSSFSLQGRSAAAALGALCNVFPDALLGIGVVRACRGLWSREDRRRLSAKIAVLGLAFTLASTLIKATLDMVLVGWADGRTVSWASYDRGVLLWQAFLGLLAFAGLASVTFGAAAATRLREEEERRAQADLARARRAGPARAAQPALPVQHAAPVRALVGKPRRGRAGRSSSATSCATLRIRAPRTTA
jgi:hypothetical protein